VEARACASSQQAHAFCAAAAAATATHSFADHCLLVVEPLPCRTLVFCCALLYRAANWMASTRSLTSLHKSHSPCQAAGAGYSLFAGKEVARALAKVAVDEKECNDK